ncbi:hypothetical protein BDFB_014715 [Asbolus verrucosus]|uniref:Uncharacterized protein n=1 Tax=Asbolus verrucosus TaxID=1661398 RepID=A0A482WAA3_ASBVE|nr:hypothetical protein BDFB_009080 [Asbolus verrucosus]RZC41687.1 hypothetical protein BDFB_014715 [Asbolus verrucosus]
MVSAEEILS